MPNINEYGYQQCLFFASQNENVIFNNLEDGTIEVFVDTNAGVGSPNYIPNTIGAFCCEFINETNEVGYPTYEPHPSTTGHTYTWDADRQECRWSRYADCDNLPPINVVLNPQGNSGAIFEVSDGETCVLNVEFDYMFKFDCQDIINVQLSGVSTQLTQLYNDLDDAMNDCAANQESLDNLEGGWNYVIPYNDNGTTFYLCITESGLPLLEATVNEGPTGWEDYLNDPQLVWAFEPEIGEEMVSGNIENQGLYLTDCTENGLELINDTIAWHTTYTNTMDAIAACTALIESINTQINDILAQEAENCIYAIDTFEELIINMAIDLQDPAQPNIVETVYTEEIFNVGQGNLVNYLNSNPLNPIYVENYDWITCDGTACNGLANILSQQMIDQANEAGLLTGTTFVSQYHQLVDLLGQGVLGPAWYHYSGTITDQTIISGITNGYVNLSLQIADSCVNFAILLDRIELNKECTRVTNTEIFVNDNPSFDIVKKCDNKKSWIYTEAEEEREYNLFMRNTDYDVNDSRLVLNTKEVDLNISIDNGIETDVWCYVNDNPCILEPCTSASTTIITSGTCVGSITGVTNWTGGTTVLPSINSGVDLQYAGTLVRLQQAATGIIPSSAFTTEYAYSGCSFVHKIDRAPTLPDRFTGTWFVGDFDGNVYWFSNQTISGGSETTSYYGDTLTGQTECDAIGSAITSYNTIQGTNFQTIYWNGVGCVFDQTPPSITATTITDDCCCDIPPLSGTNITGGTIALPPASAVTPCERVIGGLGPAGGIVYWVNPDDPCEGYEVMGTDLVGTYTWSDLPANYIGGTSTDFGAGQDNTDAILAFPHPPATPAAAACDAWSYGGYSDWFLPSIDDLVMIAANTNTLNEGGGEMGYWSSSEFGAAAGGNAWALIGATTPVGIKKEWSTAPPDPYNLYVRPVRYFNTNPCNNILLELSAATLFDAVEEEYIDCSWIYKFNPLPLPGTFAGWWLAGMNDGTVGVFNQVTVSGGTGYTVDYSEVISKGCCESFNELIQDYGWLSNKGDYYTEFMWDDTCEQCKFTQCEKPQCVDFTELLTSPVTGITTVKAFNDVISSELINVRCRKTSSSYSTLKALYERYMNSTEYCDTQSSAFDYFTMSDFGNLVGTYWVDLFEQVIPSTTIWCSNHIHGNTLYDQQKFQYKGYSMYPCNTQFHTNAPVVAPFHWTVSGAADVDVYRITTDGVCETMTQCSGVYFVSGDCGSEFLGTIHSTSFHLLPGGGGGFVILGN